jgi:hypothetical protein
MGEVNEHHHIFSIWWCFVFRQAVNTQLGTLTSL